MSLSQFHLIVHATSIHVVTVEHVHVHITFCEDNQVSNILTERIQMHERISNSALFTATIYLP